MKPWAKSFFIFIRQISDDYMLSGVLFLPFLTGCLFRFAVPWLDSAVIAVYFGTPVLSHYYMLFDLFLALITPYFFCFVSALVMLSEYDDNMVGYLAVTPVGMDGYIMSRLVIPAILSLPFSLLIMKLFSLADWSFLFELVICALSSLMSVAIALIIFAFSHNRIEGLALGKIANVYTFGIFVPFFIHSPVQYCFSFLPSFWTARTAVDSNLLFAIPSFLCSIAWTVLLYRRCERKLQNG